jgi:hypothetical protein
MVSHLVEQNQISPFLVSRINFIHLQRQVRFRLLNQVGLMSWFGVLVVVAVAHSSDVVGRVEEVRNESREPSIWTQTSRLPSAAAALVAQMILKAHAAVIRPSEH